VKMLIAVLCSGMLAVSSLAFAQDKKDAPKREPSAAQKKQQERMKDCNEEAGAKKMEGDSRKKFMSSCLKGQSADSGKASKAQAAQQDKMRACNRQAGDKKMKGDDRKKFMSECLKG
jgi:hypothetical protein